MPATIMTVTSAIGAGLAKRWIASNPMAPMLTSRIAALAKEARMEVRPQP